MADKLGISISTIARIERGESQPDAELLQKMRDLWKVNLNWLLTGEGEMFLKPWVLGQTRLGEGCLGDLRNTVIIANKRGESEVIYLSVLDTKVSAGYGIENFEVSYIDTYGIEKRLIMPYSADRCKFIEVRGDSIYPTLHEGDWIVVAEGVINTNGIYVLNRGGQLFVKRLEFRLATNTIIIKSDNPNYSPEEINQDKICECFAIIGRVILHIPPSR